MTLEVSPRRMCVAYAEAKVRCLVRLARRAEEAVKNWTTVPREVGSEEDRYPGDCEMDDCPPHESKDARYVCGCVACEDYRAKRVTVGCLCRPAKPGTVPYWRPGTWKTSGWSLRLDPVGVFIVVIGDIERTDVDNAGHLDSVLCYHPTKGEIVTSRKWLVSVGNVASGWH